MINCHITPFPSLQHDTGPTQSNRFEGWSESSELIYNFIIFNPDIHQSFLSRPSNSIKKQPKQKRNAKGNISDSDSESSSRQSAWIPRHDLSGTESMTGLTNYQVLNRQARQSIVTCRVDFDYGHFAISISCQTFAEVALCIFLALTPMKHHNLTWLGASPN